LKQEEKSKSNKSLVERLLQRRVIQSAAIYVAVAWSAVEILLTMQETLGWPVWLARVALALFIAGFPLVLVISWFRDIGTRAGRLVLVIGAASLAGLAFWITLSSSPPTKPNLNPVSKSIATVAILPFENATADGSKDYLARGFTAELIGRLSKHPDLAVIQEDSIQSHLLAGLIATAMAAELRADYLVEGTIRREDKFFEVNARLSDIEGRVLWSEVLREPYSAEQLTAAQRRISGEVARVLGTVLEAPLYCGETTDLKAMELYLRGRMAAGGRTVEGLRVGIDLLTQAVEADPYYGRAWNVLGEAHQVMIGKTSEDAPQEAGIHDSMGIAALVRALEICPTLGFAYKVVVPPYEGIENNSIDQEMQYRDALAMDPNDANLLRQYSFHLVQHGMIEEALVTMERAYVNDPLQAMMPEQVAVYLALLNRCGRVPELVREKEKLGGRPGPAGELRCALNLRNIEWLQGSGMFDDPMMHMGFGKERFLEAMFNENDSLRPEMSRVYRQGWKSNPTSGNPLLYIAMNMAALIDDLDLVFEMLDAVVCETGFCNYTLAYSPLFSSGAAGSKIRSDPRFVELLMKTSLEGYWREYGWPNGCQPEGDSFICF
jgi:TolB-like protein